MKPVSSICDRKQGRRCPGVHSSLMALRVCFAPRFAHESFDSEPANWEGVNHRSRAFEPKTGPGFWVQPVNAATPAVNARGGGRINPAGEAAYYGYALPRALNLDRRCQRPGRGCVRRGSGHFLLGFSNTNTVERMAHANSLAVRVNGRGEFPLSPGVLHGAWRADAGVIGRSCRENGCRRRLPGDKVYDWKLGYDPAGAGGKGLLRFELNGEVARCEIVCASSRRWRCVHHFGLLPVLKAWDSPGEVWIDEVSINGRLDFSQDPSGTGLDHRGRM